MLKRLWHAYEVVAMVLGLGLLAVICLTWTPFALLLLPVLPPAQGRCVGRAAIRSRQALASVDKTAAAIRSHVAPTHHVLARLLDGLALIERRHETEAMVALHEAEAELRRRGMATIATVTRAAHGVALGGDAGATFLDQARHDLRAFGVRHPDAFLGIWIGPPRPEP